MRRLSFVVLPLIFLLCGCTSTLRKSSSFDFVFSRAKTVAVMPPDIEVYRLTAGGIRELIDEWSERSKKITQEALKKYLGERYGFEIIFISEDWLKENHKDNWVSNKALYNAVAMSSLLHAYPGPNVFRSKLLNFDYTLGKKVNELATICNADTILFVNGFDHEATAGRVALMVWNIMVGAFTGVTIIPLNPSFMSMGLVDGETGDLIWFKVSPSNSEYSFRNEGNINTLVEWMTRDLLTR